MYSEKNISKETLLNSKIPSSYDNYGQSNLITSENVLRFWEECKKRDLRKQKKYNNKNVKTKINLNDIKYSLKKDAINLSKKINKKNEKENNKSQQKISYLKKGQNNDKILRKKLETRWNELKNDVDNAFYKYNYSKIYNYYYNNKNINTILTKSNQNINNLSIRELKILINKMNISTNANNLMEKSRKNEAVYIPRKPQPKPIKNNSDKIDECIKSKIDKNIKQLSNKKSLRQTLNYIFDYTPDNENYLHDGCQLKDIKKLYRKAILLLHPDKHVNSTKIVRYKSQELFKIITNMFDKYKNKHNL